MMRQLGGTSGVETTCEHAPGSRRRPCAPGWGWARAGTRGHFTFSRGEWRMWLEPPVMFQEIYLKFNLHVVAASTAFGDVCGARCRISAGLWTPREYV